MKLPAPVCRQAGKAEHPADLPVNLARKDGSHEENPPERGKDNEIIFLHLPTTSLPRRTQIDRPSLVCYFIQRA